MYEMNVDVVIIGAVPSAVDNLEDNLLLIFVGDVVRLVAIFATANAVEGVIEVDHVFAVVYADDQARRISIHEKITINVDYFCVAVDGIFEGHTANEFVGFDNLVGAFFKVANDIGKKRHDLCPTDAIM